MAPKSLRAQLNQIRAWVRQGRTDAWIAHQLEVSTAELREFRRRHELTPDDDENAEVDLRDEIEAEIEAATLAAEEEEDEIDEDEGEGEGDGDGDDEEEDPGEGGVDDADGEDEADATGGGRQRGQVAAERGGEEGAGRGRRRRRRGGRGRGRGRAKALEATFDHGEKDGYGLWLDPAVADNPSYAEHWAGHRAVEVEITPEQIVIRRTDSK